MMRLAVELEPELRTSNPELLFDADRYLIVPFDRSFDVSPDGQHSLVVTDAGTRQTADPCAGLTRIIVVQNCSEELKRRFPNR